MTRRIDVNQVPIEWNEAGDRFTFFGVEGIILWKVPSLLSILKPLREELGEELFNLLVAFEVSKGTYEDYHSMVSSLGASFEEGFTNWGRAVSGAGWGVFQLEAIDWQTRTARVRVDRPWELDLFDAHEWRNAVPFMDGKLSGIFSWAFGANCRATVTHLATASTGKSVVLEVAPSPTTLAQELERLQSERGLSSEAHLQAANRYLRENLDRFIDVVAATGEFIWEMDRFGQITYVTDRLGAVLGYSTDDLRGTDFLRLLTEDGAAEWQRRVEAAAEAPGSHQLEVTAHTEAGAVRWLALGLTATVDLHGSVAGYRGAGRDITQQKEAERELHRHRDALEAEVAEHTRELERVSHHNRLLLESIGEGVFGVDTEGRFTFINPAGAAMFGADPEDLIGQDSHSATHHTRLDGLPYPVEQCPVNATIRDGQPRQISEEAFYRLDGTAFLVEYYAAPVREGDAIRGAVVSFRDIRDRKEAEAALAARAYYDDLTGLPNRTHLIEYAEGVLARDPEGAALLIVNLDRFKDINDSLGHAVGDWLLQQVASRLYHCLADGEVLARLGSDEFACFMEAVADPDQPEAMARRFMAALKPPVAVGQQTIEAGVSVGISRYPEHGTSAEMLFKNADAALHRAKAKGSRHYQVYSAELTTEASRRVQLESALRQAIDQGAIEVHYQPQIDLDGDHLVGVEALARWHHAEWGWVSPGQFIPVAEESGLVHALGRFVLEQACEQLNRWRSAGCDVGRVAVNISPAQLEWEELEELVRQRLTASTSPGALELEVTEEAFLREPERAAAVLQRLSELGVCIAIDDFGTGYSSLAYLKNLPVDRLKIDRSFIAGIPDSAKDAAITQTVTALGRNLELAVLAEGVEIPEQAAFLQEWGVQEVQGFLYDAALPPEAVLARYGR